MHRRDILKTVLASTLGITFGYTGIVEGKGLFKKRMCNVDCSTLAEEDAKVFRPDRWGGSNTINGHTHLTYYIWNRDNDFEESIWDAEIARSFDAWAKVTNLSFELTDDSVESDMIIGVSNRKRSGFGRSGGILAWAQLPSNRHYNCGQCLMRQKTGRSPLANKAYYFVLYVRMRLDICWAWVIHSLKVL